MSSPNAPPLKKFQVRRKLSPRPHILPRPLPPPPLPHTTAPIIGARNAAPIKNREECHMALAHAIAEHLPYLRRYARALCGTQKSGDAYVRACLETIAAGASGGGRGPPPRAA